VDRVSDATAAAIVPPGTGSPVKTQEAEVDNVARVVRGAIDGTDVPGTRTQKLARYLLPLAYTAQERDTMAQLASGPGPADPEVAKALENQLTQQLNQQLDGAKPTAPDGHARTDTERKANAARLLYCLAEAKHDPNTGDFFASNEFRRFLNVVGLSGASRALDDQSLIVQKMTEEAISAHHAEQQRFVYDHDQIVNNALNLSDALERQNTMLKAKTDELEKQTALVDERKRQIQKLRDQLAELRGKTATKLAEQAEREQEVMDRLIDLRDTGKKNLELERQIRELEQQLSGR
jgi:hypothetical protein